MGRRMDGVVPPGTCWACGKRSYSSKKEAKQTARRTHPGEQLDTYECHSNAGAYHYGHLPQRVKEGRIPRSMLAPPTVGARG